MSRGIYDVCTCGHRHPEHSQSGSCRGCLDCPDVEERLPEGQEADEHPYRQCECRRFDVVEATDAAAAEEFPV